MRSTRYAERHHPDHRSVDDIMHKSRLFELATAGLLALFSLMSQITAAETGPTLSGHWAGGLQVGQREPLTLIFHVDAGEDGLEVTLDIPSQQRAAIPSSSVTLRDELLFISFTEIQAEFYGALRLSRDGSQVRRIEGDWSQSGEHIPLTLQPHTP